MCQFFHLGSAADKANAQAAGRADLMTLLLKPRLFLMHCDQAEGWEDEQEPEARPFHWDTKDGVPRMGLPQIGSAMAPAPSRARHHAGGARRGAFPRHRGKERRRKQVRKALADEGAEIWF